MADKACCALPGLVRHWSGLRTRSGAPIRTADLSTFKGTSSQGSQAGMPVPTSGHSEAEAARQRAFLTIMFPSPSACLLVRARHDPLVSRHLSVMLAGMSPVAPRSGRLGRVGARVMHGLERLRPRRCPFATSQRVGVSVRLQRHISWVQTGKFHGLHVKQPLLLDRYDHCPASRVRRAGTP
jgi:hypothetical protein